MSWDPTPSTTDPPPVPLLHEDPHLLAVFKPPGMVVQGARPGDVSLLHRLRPWLRTRDEKPGNVYLAPVHRLDRDVSGIVILAKRSKAASRLSREIREGRFEKDYTAIVEDTPEAAAGTCRGFLAWDDEARRMRVTGPESRNAKRAELEWSVRSRHGDFAVLGIRLLTGRKHQIRAQLAHAGHPVAGDSRYGAASRLPRGIALLAARVAVRHPVRPAEVVVIEVPASLDPVAGWLEALVPRPRDTRRRG